jgi:ATP-dependent Clp protease ATP-binding subunit ClpA
LTIEAARGSLLAKVPRGEPIPGQIPFTPAGKEALEGSLKQTMAMQAKAIGPEQLLLGLLDTAGGLAISILVDQHVAVDDLRRAVLNSTSQNVRQLTALRLEIVDALVALEHRDELVAITGLAASRNEAADALRERFAISPHAAQAVLDLRVSSFTKEEEQRLAQEQANLRAAVNHPESGPPPEKA